MKSCPYFKKIHKLLYKNVYKSLHHNLAASKKSEKSRSSGVESEKMHLLYTNSSFKYAKIMIYVKQYRMIRCF